MNSHYPNSNKNLITKYNDIILNTAHNTFKDNLMSLILTGSAGKDKFIDNWSDYDYLIILRETDYTKINDFFTFSKGLKDHIGITFLTLFEIKNHFISQRVMLYLYEINNNQNKILYKANNFIFPIIDVNSLFNCDEEIAKVLKSLKKNNFKTYRELFKTIVLLKKLLLRKKHIIAYDFEDIDNKFFATYNFDLLKLSSLFLTKETTSLKDLYLQTNIFINSLEELN